MTQNAYKAISAAMPDSTKYMMAYNNLYMEVANLNKEVSDKCAESKKKSFMIYHPALSYFARDYHLTQIAIENEGKEPSAKHLARIIEKARKEEIKHILYQSEFPASSVAVICEDTGATAVEINPLSEDIFATLRHITTLITE
jgi:zinc transport system substrate-binding protein